MRGRPSTVVEGLQIRNVLVWLKASVWAWWAGGPDADDEVHVNDGPVHELIEKLPDTVGSAARARSATHWDADPLNTCTLYNSTVLLVLDRNGGRITHAFVRDGDGCRTVSGTFKCYQYTAAEGGDCDGPVLQNTVYTPNHRYIGSDVGLAAGPSSIVWEDNRPYLSEPTHTLVLPDNFNAYVATEGATSVTMAYTPGSAPGQAIHQDDYLVLLGDDHDARAAGTDRGEQLWHGPYSFTKTFTVDGSTVRVSYSGAPSALRWVDNEFCVDLLAGATRGTMLTRHVSAGRIDIRSEFGAAVSVADLDGCEFTTASATETLGSVDGEQAAADFLELHRVLTDTIRVRPTCTDFSYTIDLLGNP